MTQIPTGYIVWATVIRLVLVIAFLYWTTRWNAGKHWRTRGDELTG